MSNIPYEQFDWYVHTIGPDDLEKCTSFEAAVIKCATINAVPVEMLAKGLVTEYHPLMYAVILPKPCRSIAH